jgi:hypothetical protein
MSAGGQVSCTAIEVPGSGAVDANGPGEVSSVSCPSTGNCVAGGFYRDRSRPFQGLQAFVVSQHQAPGS